MPPVVSDPSNLCGAIVTSDNYRILFISDDAHQLLQLQVGDLLRPDIPAQREDCILREHTLPDGNLLFLVSRLQTHTSVSQLQSYQETLIELSSSSLITEHNLTEALKEIVVKAARVLQVSRINIWTINDNFASISSLINYDKNRGPFLDNLTLERHELPKYFRLMETEKVIVTHDAGSDPNMQELLTSYVIPLGIYSLIDVPLRIAGRMVGVMCFEDTERRREWNVTETKFVTAVAQIVSQTFETWQRIQVQDKLSAALEEKQVVLNEMNHRIHSNLSLIEDLIEAQANKAKDDEHRALIRELKSRVASMAMIHKQLYRTSEPGYINFRDYLLDLITRMKPIAGAHHLELRTLLDNCSVHVNHALYAAMIINEYLMQMMQQADGNTYKREATIKLNVQSKQISIFIQTAAAGGVTTVKSPSDNLITELLVRLKATVEVVPGKHFGFVFSV